MTTVTASTTLSVPADKAWAKVGQWHDIRWIPGDHDLSVEGEGVGATRRFAPPHGAPVVERLEAYDGPGRSYTYSLVEGPMPVRNYRSTVSVQPAPGGGSTVQWSCSFDVDPANEERVRGVLGGLYEQTMQELKRALG